jgi:hypothetical protein
LLSAPLFLLKNRKRNQKEKERKNIIKKEKKRRKKKLKGIMLRFTFLEISVLCTQVCGVPNNNISSFEQYTPLGCSTVASPE